MPDQGRARGGNRRPPHRECRAGRARSRAQPASPADCRRVARPGRSRRDRFTPTGRRAAANIGGGIVPAAVQYAVAVRNRPIAAAESIVKRAAFDQGIDRSGIELQNPIDVDKRTRIFALPPQQLRPHQAIGRDVRRLHQRIGDAGDRPSRSPRRSRQAAPDQGRTSRPSIARPARMLEGLTRIVGCKQQAASWTWARPRPGAAHRPNSQRSRRRGRCAEGGRWRL